MIPRRLTRYVLAELAVPTLLGLSLYTFVLLMNAFFLVARLAISKNLSWELTLQLFLFKVPEILVLTVPMATLLGTLIGLGRLSSDQEWVAMQSAGLGPSALFRPVALHGLVAAGVGLAVYLAAFPVTNYASRVLQGEVLLASNLASDLRPRVFYTDLPGMVLFVDEIVPGSDGRLERVLIHQRGPAAGPGGGPPSEREQLILATRGDLFPSPDRPGSLEIDLQDGVLHGYKPVVPESYQRVAFGRYHLVLEPPGHLQALMEPPQRTVQDLGPRGLLREHEASRHEDDLFLRDFRVRRVEVEIHQRLALPVASLLFALLAVPLGVTRVRSGKGAGFALSLGVILVYWLLFTVSRDQAIQGRVTPALGVWFANGIIALWALVAYARFRRPTGNELGLLGRARLVVRQIFRSARRAAGLWRGGSRPPEAAAGSEPPAGSLSRTRYIGLVDRYILMQYARILVLALLSGYVVYSIVELKSLLDGVFQNDQPISLVLDYFKYFAPGMFNLVLPISCLVGSVVAFTVLGRTGELTAMKASGISMHRATLPVLLLTLGLCGVYFLVQDRIAPVTNRKAQQIKDEIFNRAPRTYGLPAEGRWTFGSEGRLYHYRLYDPDQKTFQGLSVFTLDRSSMRILDQRYAALARWNGVHWDLGNGWLRTFPDNGAVGTYTAYEQDPSVPLDPPDTFARRELGLASGGDLPEQLSVTELAEQIRVLQEGGYDTTRLEVAYFSKWAHPATPLVMVLLGLPFAFRIGRRGSLYAIGVALILVIVYWATFAIFNALGLETLLPPFLAAWAPNMVFAILGGYLMLYIRS
jgi:LPS export ABC transporter permease LptG/LPS export ABC transporter permease LptF